MRRPTLVATALMVAGIMGCDSLPFIGGGEEEPTTQAEQAAQQDTAQTAPVPTPAAPQPVEQAEPTEPMEPTPTPVSTTPSAMDEPWVPTHTGTVEPGMTRDQVIAVWGTPVTERTLANWTFIFFRNGCEATCGTFDVVMLDGGQVVDAIVRGRGHTYAGVSSSPPNRVAEFTPPPGQPGNMGNLNS